MYISGQDDGTPGQHPGMTPYFNNVDWGGGMVMGNPSWMTAFSYPANATWPMGEAYFNTRYVYAHSEFTPQQTMRGKIALYGFLYGIRAGATAIQRHTPHSDSGHGRTGQVGIRRLLDGNFYITVSKADFASHPDFRLFNCAGRLIREIKTQNNPGAGFILETSSLGKGIYFLKMNLAGVRTCNKIAVY
jgi:hypothetical protein